MSFVLPYRSILIGSIKNVMVLWAGFLVFKLGTVDRLHLLQGLETEGLGVCVCVFGLWSGTDCFNLSSKDSSWNRELL